MKRAREFLCCIVAALFMTVPASNVGAQSPKCHHMHGGLIEGMNFLDEDRGVFAGDGGRIAYTTDGGLTWTEAMTDETSPTSWVPLRGFFFLDPGGEEVTGWCVGDAGVVLKTQADTDGTEWTDANASSRVKSMLTINADCGTYPARLYDIFMFNSDDGMVCGEEGTLAVTANGGVTWTHVVDLTGYTVHQHFDCHENPRDLYQIHFFADSGLGYDPYDKGIIVGEYGHVYLTDDGGKSWTEVSVVEDAGGGPNLCPPGGSGHENLEFWRLSFDDPEDASSPGWLVGGVGTNKGYVFTTSGGGAASTWSQYSCYEFLPAEFAIGGGPNTICGLPTQYTVVTLDATANPQRWVTGGYGGSIFAHEAGDANFDPCECEEVETAPGGCGSLALVQKPYDLEDPEFMSARTPFFAGAAISATEAAFAGSFGRIARYTHGSMVPVEEVGSRWWTRLEDATFWLDGTDIIGLAVGQGLAILRTDDGGETWEEASLPSGWTFNPSHYWYGVAMSDDGDHGVVVGTGGRILRTEDGGETWLEVSSKPGSLSSDLLDVTWVPGESVVYAVTSSRVLVSDDDGDTWDFTGTDPSNSPVLYSVAFADEDVGYVVGSTDWQNGDAVVYRTLNGGTTWTSMEFIGGSASALHDIVTWDGGDVAVAVGTGGSVFEKTAVSARFSKLSLGHMATSEDFYDVEAVHDGPDVHLRIGGNRGTVRFRNEGGSWSTYRTYTNLPIRKLSFLDLDEGFAIGPNFRILKFE